MNTISVINKLIDNYNEDFNEIVKLLKELEINNQYHFMIFFI